jgi:hypothetical protein
MSNQAMDDKATAARLLDQITFSSTKADDIDAIVAALEAARREGFAEGIRTVPHAVELEMLHNCRRSRGIIDCTGEVPCVRRVLGHLAITKDGWVIGDDCRVWQDGQMWNTELFRVPTEANGRWAPYRTDKVYSTESAAKDAMEGGKA